MSEVEVRPMPFEGNNPGPSTNARESESNSPSIADSSEILKMLSDPNQMFGEPAAAVAGTLWTSSAAALDGPKSQLERLLAAGFEDASFPADGSSLLAFDLSPFGTLRNTSKTLKCPKCNWHYKYQETLEIHMKEKHADVDVKCVYCVENRQHPKLARGESYSCGYKPYRCELCKYSTTTKGNLSIHMQSDKHLHAMQELPNNIANFSCPPLSRCSPIQENDSNFMCLVCGAFSTDSPREFVEHAEKDRSRPSQGDVSVCGGTFRCHLCPYSTTLKANFQLHTRTDKHIQKVQTANHIREGASGQSALYRLASTKSVFQVLCKSCQEVLSSATSLREHCESASHRQQLRKGIVIFSCKLCPFESPSTTDAIGHMTCHEPSTWPLEMIEDSATLEAHAKSHEAGDQCPLCPDRSPSLIQHLIHEHKIAESAVDRLLAVHRPPSDGSSGFAFRCAQCSMAFRSEASLQSHSIVHLFATTHKCSTCDKVYADADKLKVHISEEHPRNVGGDGDEQRCELCFESFPSPAAIAAHNNSARHLHKAKQHLEKGSVDLSAQVFGVLQKPSSPGSDKSKKFRCNVCNQHYGQGATLDIHLRSVAHQTRMGRVAELVANGEIDASLAVVEQPGGPPQALIKDLIRKDDEPASRQMSVMDMMNMFLAPKIFPDASSGETTPPEEATTTTSSDEPSTSSNVPRTGIQLLSQIQVYGEDKLIGLVPSLLGRMRAIAAFDEATVAALNKFDCDECGETLHGVLALNLHYEEAHSANIPNDVLRNFGERLSVALSEFDDCDQATNGSASPKFRTNGEEYSGERPEKRQRGESSSHSEGAKQPDLTQLAMFSMMGFPFMPAGAMGGFMSPAMSEMFPMMHNAAAMASSPAKRARTRITDDQLKILRQYFDINNSPTEAHIKEMSLKAGLPEKVIKHWFRNTLFKERQRDKDSPYNFSIPPQMSIDLDAYERTGETKVVTLSNEPKLEPSLSSSSLVSIASPSTAPEEKKVVQPLTPVTAEPAASLPTTPLNLQAMLSQMHANSFPFMDAASFMGAGSIPQMAQQSTSSGRRANRTRFTDFQLRTLQTFFDRQAYPKDDDLEILSKKLQLSPRVIVVWFQNARQKARKIYENQPNHENSDRFVRTPGSNFQCKRCSQVFQRYYELIQHQQKKCYKDDGAALVNDNKSVEESLTEEEKLVTQAAMPSVSDLKIPADFLKLLGNSKSNTDVLLKMCETVGTSTATTVAFYKRCPFCGVSFRCRKTMGEHLQTKHAQQMLLTHIDLDLLPNVEEVHVPSFLSADSRDIANAALDLSGSSSQDYSRESLSMSPHPGHSDDDVMTEALEDSPFANFPAAVLSSTGGSHSPANNKRYRTHLTPIQVHVMKNVFAEYKTPSMAECEMLGHEIGLHKRVVQVWFQNARAKERKTRPPNAEEEQKPAQSSCLVCGVEYGGRISMQDHLFSAEHINRLKVQLKSEGISEMSTAGGEAEKRARPSSQTPTSSAAALNLSSFPFSLVNNMLAGNLPFIDVNIFGTPITMLQIPEAVKLQITSDIASTTIHSTTFTQDGESIETLRELLSDEEKELVQAKDKEVGWACPSCSNVFQELSKLKEHQRTICQNCDSTFTLVQTHYECSLCGVQVGMQKDYVSHTTSAMHQKACGARQQLSSQI